MVQNILKEQKQFSVLFITVSIVVFIVVALRSYLVPFNHDETATFFMYIQSGKYWPFHSQVDANNHVLNSFLGNICFHLFGSSPFSSRLPNLIGLIILIIATYRICKKLNHFGSKVFLTAGILVSFHWITFFSACRGYGISMAMLLMGIALLMEYIEDTNYKNKFLCCLLFFQLAISANLILIIVVLLLSAIIAIVQLFNKTLFKPIIIIAWLIHLGAIYYWLSFSFFLQDNGALYYGAGDSYWKVTFVSLVQLIFGFENSVVKYSLILLFILVLVSVGYLNRNAFMKLKELFKKPSLSLLFAGILAALCLGFYLMHKLMGVNYPEDRTGLFFYLFFVLLIAFTFDLVPLRYNRLFLLTGSALFIIHFAVNLNFRKHSLNVYETIPEHFYTTLINEQAKSQERITIGGHRVRELFYAFINYRHGSVLNSADPTEVMQMNCDYYLATRVEEKYFKPYYDIIDSEPDWGFVLLKRKQKIIRTQCLEVKNTVIKDNANEFIEIYSHADTTFANTKPLLAEVNFNIDKIPVPVNAWLVLQVNDSLDQTVYFKRYPLQWTGYDNNGKKNLSYSLIIGNLPKKSKKITCFFWNIEQKALSIKVNSLKIYQLDGQGVDYEAPDTK
ncbi:MAG: hypothetical protein V4565_15420 [Bacteroidota bacterium]